MPRPPINLSEKVADMLEHVGPLPGVADSPFAHYSLSTNAAWGLRKYFDEHVRQSGYYQAVLDRHMLVLNNMILVQLVESFERLLNELAAVCIDHLCKRVIDNRFDSMSVSGNVLAFFFQETSPGKALCEADTWLNCKVINTRFRKFLADPFEENGNFIVFPFNTDEFRTMSVVWQIRHSVVHNVGAVTQSDAARLKHLSRRNVESPRMLQPERDDLRHLKRFLDERANDINDRIGHRLAELLSTIYGDDNSVFAPQEEADVLSAKFGIALNVAGATGTVPLP